MMKCTVDIVCQQLACKCAEKLSTESGGLGGKNEVKFIVTVRHEFVTLMVTVITTLHFP
jgi:hypothetical protein